MSTTLFLELFKVTLLAKAVVREEKGKGGPFLSLKMLLCSPKCHFFTFFHHAESCPSKKKEKKKKNRNQNFHRSIDCYDTTGFFYKKKWDLDKMVQ